MSWCDWSHIDQNYTDDILKVMQNIESVFGNKSLDLAPKYFNNIKSSKNKSKAILVVQRLTCERRIAINTAGEMSLPTARIYLGLGELFYR